MKKVIIKTSVFLFFAGLFYIAALFIWARYSPSIYKPNINYRIGSYGHLYTRLSEVRKNKDVDILFLGSSHAYRGFDTRIFSHHGLKTFNLGSSSQTPIQTIVLLNRYLETLNPKTIIYEVYPETFMCDGVESSLDIIANDKNDSYSVEMAFKINNIKTYNTLIYGIIHDLFNLNKSYVEPIVRGNDKYIPGGYVEKEISYYKPEELDNRSIAINDDQLQSFAEIVNKVKGKGIKLILVYAPIPHSNYIRYSNNKYFDSLMESYSEYYNFNEVMTLNDSLHFFDSHHLNQNGVELFDAELIKTIEQKVLTYYIVK